MSGHPPSTYEPKTGIERWLDARLPIVRLGVDMLDFPTPKNLNYWWTFGGILAVCLVTQILTGTGGTLEPVPSIRDIDLNDITAGIFPRECQLSIDTPGLCRSDPFRNLAATLCTVFGIAGQFEPHGAISLAPVIKPMIAKACLYSARKSYL